MPLCIAPLYIVQWQAILHYVCEPATVVQKIETLRNFVVVAILGDYYADLRMSPWRNGESDQYKRPTALATKILMNALKLLSKQTMPRVQKFGKIPLSCGLRTQSKYSIEYA